MSNEKNLSPLSYPEIASLDQAIQAVENILTAIHEDLGNWGNIIRQDRQTLPGYQIERRDIQRRFQAFIFQRERTVREVVIHVSFEHTFVVHPDNVNILRSFLHEQINRLAEHPPFLITFSSVEQYINIRPGAFEEELLGYLEEYEGGLYINDVTVHCKAPATERSRQREEAQDRSTIVARAGEGVPQIIGNYCILDVVPSNMHCVINVFLYWKYYKEGKLDDFLGSNKNAFKLARKKLEQKLKSQSEGSTYGKAPEIHTPSTIQLAFDYEYIVLHDKSSIDSLLPQDTMHKCIYYYCNDHVGLVVNKNYLTDQTWNKLVRTSERTYLRLIQKTKPKQTKHKLNVADIECLRIADDLRSQYNHQAFILGLYDGEQYICFRGEDCLDEFFQYVILQNCTMQVWFHNGGKYDHHILLESATRYSDDSRLEPISFTDLSGRLIRMIVNLKNGYQLILQDSYALLPSSLDKLSKDLNVTQKMTVTPDGVDVDIVNVTKEELLHSPILLEYNRLDCISLYESLEAYKKSVLEEFGIDPLACVSASSLSKNVYYSRFYRPDIYPLYVLVRIVHEFIEKSYKGGRNECFFRGMVGEEKLYHYDIKSQYPYAGCQPLPYGVPTYFNRLNVKDVTSFLTRYPGFYEITIIKSPKGILPLLGVFHDFKYIFPEFENYGKPVFFSAELLKAVQLGYQIKIHRGYHFKLGQFYKDYFEELFAIKERAEREGKPALRQAGKITANSGYGFQGFKKYDRRVLRSYGKDYQECLENMRDQGLLDYAEYNGIFFATQKVDILLQDVNVAVAAAITSYARLRLYDIMEDILKRKYRLYYCDTDSIITDCYIEALPDMSDKYMYDENNKTLGYLVNEVPKGDEIVESVFIACKTYGYRTKQNKIVAKAKGVHKPDNIEELYESLKSLQNNPVQFTDVHISTSRAKKIRENLSVTDELRKKVISGIYTKGIVNKDGSISPLLLSNQLVAPSIRMDVVTF